ncbi:hypothetical protein GBF35_05170 [Nonomuraea phyllanthi]|uniref:hypothetical protein n=1 Tax=Nonomuraea phyllanthi TaxID=2219224 RepID=UPI00129337BC|nr:hypothetical protein [Nonomuraea phyllanthi]QFY06146.1 hypothetical protein GBF35_05170 [Nonomuraea phyllanthi]
MEADDAKAAYDAFTAEQKAAVDAALKQYLDNLPSQGPNNDDPVGTQDVYGPFGTWGSCQMSGVAGVLAGLWSYFECWKDTYGSWWLATL